MVRTLIVVAALAVLVACGGQTVAEDPPSSSAPVVSASASATASVLPPVMPALAKEHTEAGAKAWFAYFWSVLDYAASTYDTKQLTALMSSACAGCSAGLKGIRDDEVERAVVRGGAQSATNISAKFYTVGGQLEAVVSGDVTNTEQVIAYPSPRAPQTFTAGTHHVAFAMRPTAGGWRVTEWNPAQ